MIGNNRVSLLCDNTGLSLKSKYVKEIVTINPVLKQSVSVEADSSNGHVSNTTVLVHDEKEAEKFYKLCSLTSIVDSVSVESKAESMSESKPQEARTQVVTSLIGPIQHQFDFCVYFDTATQLEMRGILNIRNRQHQIYIPAFAEQTEQEEQFETDRRLQLSINRRRAVRAASKIKKDIRYELDLTSNGVDEEKWIETKRRRLMHNLDLSMFENTSQTKVKIEKQAVVSNS